MRRIILFVAAVLFTATVFAQGGYRLDVKQVFPTSATVYSNSFDIRRELDNAVAAQTAKLRGNTNNYKLQIKTPSGSETRTIQNIVWIQSVNGVKSNHRGKTYPKESYNEPTVWEGYSCNIDGSRKGTGDKYEYVYRVAKTIDGSKYGVKDGEGSVKGSYETPFIQERQAPEEVDRIYGKNFVREKRVEVVMYRFSVGKEYGERVYEKTNEKEYLEYVEKEQSAKQKEEQEKIRQANMRKVDEFRVSMNGLKAEVGNIKVKDSVTIKALHSYREVLSGCQISDSLFFKEKLDTVYQNTVREVLMPYVKKKNKALLEERIAQMTEDATAKTKSALLACMKKIEEILIPVKVEKKEKKSK